MIKTIERFDGTTVSNGYDSSARLTSVTCPDATNTITYYDNTLLKTIGNGSSTISNQYDGANRLLSQSFMSFMPFMVSYLLDPIGNATNVLVSINSSVVITNNYTFDAAERVSSISAYSPQPTAFLHSYNQYNGLLAAVSNTTSGINASYQFDNMDRLTNIVWRKTSGNVLRSFGYKYNNAGMITNIARETAAESTAYNYDSLDRLVAATSSAYTNSYGWDLAGNPTSRVENAGTTTYTLGTGNKLASWTGGSYKHDSAGCITNITHSNDSLALTWDSQYQLTSVSTNGAVAESYKYDSLGRRTCSVRSQSGNSITNYYIYDGIHVVAETDSAGTLKKSYTWGTGIDNLLSFTTYGSITNTYYAITDHLGTVHAVTDSSGNIVESYKYDSWGRVLKVLDSSDNELTESAIGNRYLWQGREYSWTTGLYYFRARWYDPVTGRWLSKDPIGIYGGLNQFVFCNNNGVNFVDPFGLQKMLDTKLHERLAKKYNAVILQHAADTGEGALLNLATGVTGTGAGFYFLTKGHPAIAGGTTILTLVDLLFISKRMKLADETLFLQRSLIYHTLGKHELSGKEDRDTIHDYLRTYLGLSPKDYDAYYKENFCTDSVQGGL